MRTVVKGILGEELTGILAYPPYLLFILSVVFSQVGANMLNVTLIYLVYLLTSSNFSVSILIMTFILPQIFLSFIGGMFAERRNRKKILKYGNLLRAATILLLFFNPKSIILMFVVSFIVAVVSQFYVPVETPVIPQLVKKQFLGAANSIFGIALFGSILIGYVLSGPMLRLLGRSNMFLLVAAFFSFAALFIHLIPCYYLSDVKKDKDTVYDKLKTSIRAELKKTYTLIANLEGVGISFFLLILSQIIILVMASIVPGYAKNILGIEVEDISLLLFTPAALGMFISSIIIGRSLWKRNREKVMVIGIFISGFVFCTFPYTSKIASKGFIIMINSILPEFLKVQILHITIILAFFLGFSNALIFIPSQTLIQDKVPEVFRSKVYGLLFSLTGLLSILPIIITGGIADIFGVGTVLFMIGLFLLFIGLLRLITLFIKPGISPES